MKIILLNMLVMFFELIGGLGLAGIFISLYSKDGIHMLSAIGLFLAGLFGTCFIGSFL